MYYDEDLGPWCSDDYRPRSRYHSQMTVPFHKEKTEIKEIHQTMHSILTAKKSELPKLKLNSISPRQVIKQQYINKFITIKESSNEKHFLPQLSLIKMKPQNTKPKNRNRDIHVIFEIEKIIRRNHGYIPNHKYTTSTII
ncbi:unnamed protein product [Paramecium pentaurelia]|uniref:Uncharacterized protein n=1 Tax=Paramecium pentaurelia TaxID=43138 RepID=A0A8S1UGD9_9CILI|nr:unnamed protein product [Paramecium pentaurelia]